MLKFILVLVGISILAAVTVPSALEAWRAEPSLRTAEEKTRPASVPPFGDASVAAEPGRVTRLEADMSGHYRTTARLNGRAEDVLVDTGATYVAVSETTARRLGIRLTNADYTHTASTANGRIAVALATLDRVEVGHVSVRDVEVMVAKGEVLGTTLLGMSFLGKLKSYRAEGGRLTLVE